MPFLGSTPADKYQSLAKQTITGDGSTAYTLNRSVTNAYDMEVFINNVRQEPDTSYTASGNTITFTAAVTASDSCYLIYQGQSVGSINPPAGSVGGTQIQNTSVTNAHLAGSITDAKLHSSLDLSSKTLTMPAGHVIQVTPLSTSTSNIHYQSNSFVNITGLSVTMTPLFASSDIYVIYSLITYHLLGGGGGIQVMQDGSAVANQGSNPSYENYSGNSDLYSRLHRTVLVPAGSISSRTYSLQIRTYAAVTLQSNTGGAQSFMYALEVAR